LKTLKNAVLLMAGRLGCDGLTFVLFVLIAREFGPTGLGAYSFTLAVAAIFFEVITLGAEEYGVREYARRQPAERVQLVGNLLGAQLAVTVVALLVVTILLVLRFLDWVYLPLLTAMLIYQTASAMAYTLFIPTFAAGKVHVQVSAEILSRVGILGVGIGVLYSADHTLSGVVAGYPIFGFALLLTAALFARGLGISIAPRLSLAGTAGLLRRLWSFAGAQFMLGLYARTGVVLVFVVAGSAQSGLFSSAFKFVEVGGILLTMLPWAAYAQLSWLHDNNPERFRSLSFEVLRASLLLAGLLAWGVFWILPVILPELLGDKFSSAEVILKSLAGSILLSGTTAYLAHLMLVAKFQVARFWVTFAQTAIAIVLCLALVPRMGALGAVIGLVVAQLAAMFIGLGVLRHQIDIPIVLRTMGVFLLSAAAAMTAGEGASLVSGAPWLPPAAALAALLLATRSAGLYSFTQVFQALR